MPALRLIVAGLALAFALVLLVLLTGLGAGRAHADDGGGALSGLASTAAATVAEVADEAIDGVADTTTATADLVQSSAQAAPPPLTAAVQPVAQAAGTVVPAAAAPVVEVLDAGIVSGVVDPVVDVATAVPVAGTIVQAGGVDEVLTDAAAAVDGITSSVGAVVEGAPSALPPSQAPADDMPAAFPALPVLPALSGSLNPDAVRTGPQRAQTAVTDALPASGATRLIGNASRAAVAVLASAGPLIGGILSSALGPGVCAPGGGFPTGSGGAGPGALALIAFAPFAAHRAWVRRRGPDDDEAPPAPILGTDVSPD